MENNVKSEIVKEFGATAQKAFDFIEKIIGAPIMEGTGMLTDKIKYLRFKNQVNTILKAQEFIKAKGLDPKKVPLKDITTLMEYASFEDEPKMQEKWAALLANAADPNNRFNLCHIFSQTLNQISAHEVAILDYMFSKCFWSSDKDRPFLQKNEILRKKFTSYEITLLIFDNLLRLRLIEEQPTTYIYGGEIARDEDGSLEDNSLHQKPKQVGGSVRLSEFGVEFVRQTKFSIDETNEE